MKESLDVKKTRTRALLRKLRARYPGAHCALHHSCPLELLVATILSAQCTDERVNKVTPGLFRRYRSAADYAGSDVSELEGFIRTANFYRNKAKNLKQMGAQLVREHGGEVPREMSSLVALPGVGRKTANVVLGNAFGIATGIVVDTHVRRLSFRLGLSRAEMPEKVEADLLQVVPKKDWIDFSHLLIFHGRQVCQARKPRCEECVLNSLCPKVGVKGVH
ncbi:MAG: endonuclease III [Bdellovibrionales bacterium]